MLDNNKSGVFESITMELASNSARPIDGSAMVRALEGGVAKARLSIGGGDTGLFLGFAHTQHVTLSRHPRVDELKVVAGSATLTKTPVGGISVRLVNNTYLTAYVADPGDPEADPPVPPSVMEATEFSISGRVLTLDASLNGAAIQVVYDAAVSELESTLRYGQGLPNDGGLTLSSGICIISRGKVKTTNYDVTSPWAAGSPVYLGAAGIVTMTAGDNTLLPQVFVESLPTTFRPSLGLISL